MMLRTFSADSQYVWDPADLMARAASSDPDIFVTMYRDYVIMLHVGMTMLSDPRL
jgi:hypothetical protein